MYQVLLTIKGTVVILQTQRKLQKSDLFCESEKVNVIYFMSLLRRNLGYIYLIQSEFYEWYPSSTETYISSTAKRPPFDSS